MSEIKAIFFDAAGTLLHAHPSVGHVYAEVVSRYGPTVDAQTLDAAFRKAFAARRSSTQSSILSDVEPRGDHVVALRGPQSSLVNEGYDWWRGLVFDVLASLQIDVRDPDLFFRELYWRFAEAEVWRLFPDALPALLEARGRGLKIGLISNWDVRLRRLIEGMDIAPLFDAIVISTEVGLEKPDPRIFCLACQRLGVEASESVHVGDHMREDVKGATAAGVATFFLNRSGTEDRQRRVVSDLCQVLR